MRQVWVIFKKDARRFWPEIALTWVLLAWLVRLDSWRSGFTPTSAEGWLNLLLPFAWAYLTALVITEDALVGDRQFWLALPSRWASVFAAKLLFVIAFVHLPYGVASTVILSARGFSPWNFAAELLTSQINLLAVITLPAIAVAALVRNSVQFILAALVLIALVVVLSGSIMDVTAPWIRVDNVRTKLAFTVFSIGAVFVAVLQYRARRVGIARAIGILAGVAAAGLYTYFPKEVSASMRCRMNAVNGAGAPVAVAIATQPQTLPLSVARNAMNTNRAVIAIPLEISGIADPRRAVFDQVALQVAGSGSTYKTEWPTGSPRADATMFGYVWLSETGQWWQIMTLNRRAFDQLRSAPVDITATITADFFRQENGTSVPVGARRYVPSVGICSSSIREARIGDEMLSVICESPAGIPRRTRVTLIHPSTGREWKQGLGDSMTSVPYPRNTWLSPVVRRDTFFHLTPEDVSSRQGSQWLVPRDAVANAHLVISPEPAAGCKLVHYELPNVRLSAYVVVPPRGALAGGPR
jgi:hypothetical protein